LLIFSGVNACLAGDFYRLHGMRHNIIFGWNEKNFMAISPALIAGLSG
jgi:uncharacterized protein YbbK (DUF523 family)